MFPSFYVISVLYSPPGHGSSVTYGDQDSVGSSVSTVDSIAAGVAFSISGSIAGSGVGVNATFSTGTSAGSATSVTMTAGSSVTLTSMVDALDHTNDTFLVLTNGEIELSQESPGAPVVETLSTIGGEEGTVIPLTVGELQNPSLIPSWKQAYLTALMPSDYQAMLSLDPLVPVNPALAVLPQPDPSRYVWAGQYDVDGPDAPGDDQTVYGVQFSNVVTASQSTGWTSSVGVSVTFTEGFSLFDVLKAQVQESASLTWTYSQTTTWTQGTTQSASASLTTPTVGFHQVYDVWYDTAFNSFAFAPPPPASILPGE
jgi:hypothetical protein